MVKHTPGPWIASHNPVTTDLNCRVSSNDFIICEMPDPRFFSERFPRASEKETLANAALIAAAPEMLHELESIICDLNKAIDGKYTLSENDMQIYVNAFSRVCEKARGQ